MSHGPDVLRPEARSVEYDSLSESQLSAIKKIAAALNEAVGEVSKLNRSNAPDELIDQSVSRLFFVSGQPGSGKSSLYHTLSAVLGKEDQHTAMGERYREKIRHISSLRGRTRWLEPIDLEVAGDEGENLLAAVLVRIFRALDDSSGIRSKECQEALNQLNELANDIGIAWDGNLRARAPSLDPDSYSQEVMSAQRARLGTNKRLGKALQTLLKKECFAPGGEALLVLPIDDFYLKPAASLELLRLLRMISVPQLFFLIMGDIKTVEALFFEKALADWTAVAGPKVFASLEIRKRDEVLSRVREMRARYLRKLLPPGQRATIEWMRWHEALEYRPMGTNSSSRLHELLRKIELFLDVPREEVPSNLLDYILFPRYSESPTVEGNHDGRGSMSDSTGEKERTKNFQEANSGLLVLDATPREIADLWMRLTDFLNEYGEGESKDDKGVPQYLWMIVDCVLLAIEEQDFLTEEVQEILRFAFPASRIDDLLVETDKFRLKPKVRPRLIKASSDVVVREHLDWKFRISESNRSVNNNNEGHGPGPFLPPRQAAWIILLHDLAWNWKPHSVTENLVHKLLERTKNRCTLNQRKNDQICPMDPKKDVPNSEETGWAWYKNSEENWVHFPFPKSIDTVWQLDRLLKVWSKGLEVLNLDLDTNKKSVVLLWIYAAKLADIKEEIRYKNLVKKYVEFVEKIEADNALSRTKKDNALNNDMNKLLETLVSQELLE